MKYFIGKINTSKGYRWYLFTGKSVEDVNEFMKVIGHHFLDGSFKEINYDKYSGFKKTLGLKTLNA